MTDPSNPISVDREWAESLVGLRMLVESRWWDGYDDGELNPGTIADVDFDDSAVLKYADETHRSYHTYKLPIGLLADPEDEEVTLAQLANSLPPHRQPTVLHPTHQPTTLHNPTTDDFSVQQTSDFHPSDDDASFDHNDNNWSDNEEEANTEDHNFEEPELNNQPEHHTPHQQTTDTNPTKYTRTLPEEWQKIGSVEKDSQGRNVTVTPRTIQPLPFTGTADLFTPNITDVELESLKDANGDIRFESVFELCLPRFGDNQETDYFEFVAARMRNYMIHIMRTKNFKPRHYNPAPTVGRTIQSNHVARFYGIHMARMTRGFPSIEETWSSREILKHIGPATESMPKDAYNQLGDIFTKGLTRVTFEHLRFLLMGWK
eukprot:scaffold1870_cov73-Cyclotella_meneghiniana.AAC.3